MLPKPFNRPGQSFFKWHTCFKPKVFYGAPGADRTERLPIRHAGIPYNLPGETRQAGYHLNQVFNRDFMPLTKIDRLVPVVTLGCQQDTFGGIINIQELARRRAIPPYHNFVPAFFAGFDTLAD